MPIDISKEIEKIEEKKLSLQKKQKMLMQKEKQSLNKKLETIGRVAYQTNISDMDPQALLGAFLEIADKSKDRQILNQWIARANQEAQEKNTLKKTPLSISFKVLPSKEVKIKLREMGFKWNEFRGEYYGYGDSNEVHKLLKESTSDYQIETID